MQLLVSAGADTQSTYPRTGIPCHILATAAACNNVRWIQRLIAAGCIPDAPMQGHMSDVPLLAAITTCSLEAAAELLRSGAITDIREMGCSLLAAALAGCEPMVRLLAEAGADMASAIYAAAALLGVATAAAGTGHVAETDNPVVAAAEAVAPARVRAGAEASTVGTASTVAGQLRLSAAMGYAPVAAAAAMDAAAVQHEADSPGGQVARDAAAQGETAAARSAGTARAHAGSFRTPAHEQAALQLLVWGAGGINAVGGCGDGTALHAAAVQGEAEAVQVLLQHGAALDAAADYGMTPLGLACCNRPVRVVQMLLAAGVEPTETDVLCAAAAEGAEADLQTFLAAGAPATETEPGTGNTALYFAARNGVSAATIQQLSAAGADVNAKNSLGFTALHGAAAYGHAHTLQALLDAGADVRATDEKGNGVLHVAALHGVPAEVIRLLVDAGAVVDAQTTLQTTPLHMAMFKRHEHVMQALIAAGADVRVQNSVGTSALHLAAEHGAGQEAIQQLIAAGADLAAQDKSGATPLLVAVEKHQLGVVQVLLAAGVGADTQAHCGMSPLQQAVTLNNPQIVRMLLRAGANPNFIVPRLPPGVKLLSLAIMKASCEVVTALLDAGAVAAEPDAEYDAVQAAFDSKRFEMVLLLLAHPKSQLTVSLCRMGFGGLLRSLNPLAPCTTWQLSCSCTCTRCTGSNSSSNSSQSSSSSSHCRDLMSLLRTL